ncbi:hypothetical protein CKC_03530 [Candidatus Liberibacter solanacearum CLso-ZC1]|uniref:Transmembrane protein n=1 Tax=Liberibacter solanacearum (strain CLso-ZC1) TaxID=658172 RepID=E4UBF0_LIBSC|nr:hypothetical protein CKC_03530 [Candidatus Liberibacter solanacearum CLso-ZC1]
MSSDFLLDLEFYYVPVPIFLIYFLFFFIRRVLNYFFPFPFLYYYHKIRNYFLYFFRFLFVKTGILKDYGVWVRKDKVDPLYDKIYFVCLFFIVIPICFFIGFFLVFFFNV